MKATKEGKLYYETKDFFQIPKVKETILKLLDSDIIKEIDKQNESRIKRRNGL